MNISSKQILKKINCKHLSLYKGDGNWYAENKEKIVKELAEIYKNSIDKRAYDGLICWKAYNTEV